MKKVALPVIAACAIASGGTAIVLTDDASCKFSNAPVIVDLDNSKHFHILDHTWDAISGGHPVLLHIDRDGANLNRRESLRGIKTKLGYDRDEYPPAVSEEGGKGADVRYVISSENRSAGSIMGKQLRDYCETQEFMFEERG